MDTVTVTCPTCFECFEVPAPPVFEVPAQLDYDCEICCRPIDFVVTVDDQAQVSVQARLQDE